MRAALTSLLAPALLLAAPFLNAAVPPAPSVTAGADIKQLTFDWDDAAGAAYYRLLYKVGSGDWKPLIDNIPASTTQAKVSVAVHLQSWSLLRYAVAACNTDGCSNSAAVFPQNLMLDAIGYFKASNGDPGDVLGNVTALSDDGRTLAVTAKYEGSNAAGVNGNQADNSSQYSGAVYVFRRVGSGWRQEAYLKAGVNQPGQYFGSGYNSEREALAVNGNGTLVAVGTSAQTVNGVQGAGAVYIYQRSSAGSWSLAATLQSPAPSRYELFGYSVDMSLDGRTLKVNSYGTWDAPDSSPWFRTYVFVRAGTTWQHSATLPRIVEGDYCQTTRMSRDGQTVVELCNNFFNPLSIQTFKRSGDSWINVSVQPFAFFTQTVGLALDADATTMAVQEASFQQPTVVGIYQWAGATWARETGIAVRPYNPRQNEIGNPLVLNGTGNLLAIGDQWAMEDGAGVSPASQPGSVPHGAVYVWKRNDSNATWSRRSVVKSPNPDAQDRFGASLAMCGSGTALAVGAEGESSKARGIDGDRTDNSTPGSGAAYLY